MSAIKSSLLDENFTPVELDERSSATSDCKVSINPKSFVDPLCDLSEEDIQPCVLTKLMVNLHTVILIKRNISQNRLNRIGMGMGKQGI